MYVYIERNIARDREREKEIERERVERVIRTCTPNHLYGSDAFPEGGHCFVS